MDYNLAFSAIGYGSVRVLRERRFSTSPHSLPAHWILQKSDPVQFCIEALSEEHPDFRRGPGDVVGVDLDNHRHVDRQDGNRCVGR
ncbi:MAG TPA: hypothetical protein PKW21_09205, partial [Rhabdaerophilum sp.]|nr:hypothetical protein [Rhabdaerophilum sp.]